MFSTGAGSDADDAIPDFDGDGAVDAVMDDGIAGFGGVGVGVVDGDGDGAPVGEGSESAEPADGADEPFWGLQSEGLVATGIGLRAAARRLARVCLAVALGLGIVFWAVLVVLYTRRIFQGAVTNPDMPHLADGRPQAAYYLLGSLWAVGIGAWALATRGGFARLTWCFACLVTAFFWPLGMAASVATVAIRRPTVATSRRLLLGGMAVLLIAGGSAWRLSASPGTPKPAAVASDADLLGTWRSHSGMSVELRSDGTYAASALSGGGLGDGDGLPASSGRWDSETSDAGSGVRLQVDGELANSVVFDVYRAGPDLVLCVSADPDSPCDVALRRF